MTGWMKSPQALVLLCALLLTAILSLKGPLQDVHWDAPIYLLRAQTFAESDYLRALSRDSKSIAEELHRFKAEPGQSTAYWGFIRLGNTVLLGIVNTITGGGVESIQAAFVLYVALVVCAVILAAMLAVRLASLLDGQTGRRSLLAGALLSGALYVASDVCRHLAGNFVAEVPALFLLGLAGVALVSAIGSRSIAMAVASGAAAFLLYVTKVDGVWTYVCFLVMLAVAVRRCVPEKMWWPGFIAAGATAALLYTAYAAVFWPLADPRLLLVLARAHSDLGPNSVAPVKLWVVAGGLLWLGLALALRHAATKAATWFAVAWLLLTLLPQMPSSFEQRPMQVRVFALIMPPLMLASTVGFSALVERLQAGRSHPSAAWVLGAAVAVLVAISHAEPYTVLRALPGAWRIQHVREWLSPPKYERLSFPLADIVELNGFLYGDDTPKVLVVDHGRNAELFTVMEYLKPRHQVAGAAERPVEPFRMCGQVRDLSRPPAVFHCLSAPPADRLAALGPERRTLELRRLADEDSAAAARGGILWHAGSLALADLRDPL